MKTTQETKKPKTKKALKIALLVLLSLILIFGVSVIWFVNNGIAGLFKASGVSGILGFNKQIQIEQTESNTDKQKFENGMAEKLGYNIAEYDREDLKGKKSMNIQLDGQEAAYLISKMQKDNDTIKNVQVKIDEQDNLILSAVMNVDNTIKAFGADKSEIEDSIGELPQEVPLYTEIHLDNKNEASTINGLKIGKMSVPKIVFSPINKYVDKGVEDFFDEILGIDLKYISVSDGTLTIEGRFPSP